MKSFIIAFLVCTYATHLFCAETQPQINEVKLAQLIFVEVTNACPKIDTNKLSGASRHIASSVASSGTNAVRLEDELKKIFLSKDSSYAFFDSKQNQDGLTKAAGQIAAAAYPLNPDLDIRLRHITGDVKNVWVQANFWTGARISNPYTINGTTLESAGTSTDGYIEFSVSSRYVLRSGSEASDPVWRNIKKTPEDGKLHFVCPLRLPDSEGRLGYMFTGSEAPTNFDANTVVGSSDFYVDYTVGIPFFRVASTDGAWKQQWTIELNGGFTTDKDSLDIHPTAFFGVGWQASYKLSDSTNRLGYWLGRVGYAVFDQPVLVPGTSTVVFNQFQKPEFDGTWAPSMGAVFVYPITSSISVQAGVNAYFTSQPPSSWNASLGITLDIGKFFSAFK